MSKRDFKDYICRPFCKFFREGHKEEMACRGASVIEHMVQSGLLNPPAMPQTGKSSHLWDQRDPGLEVCVCRHCEFRAEGCDFQSPNRPPDAEPCGGYILLSLLMEQGMLTLSNIEEMCSA